MKENMQKPDTEGTTDAVDPAVVSKEERCDGGNDNGETVGSDDEGCDDGGGAGGRGGLHARLEARRRELLRRIEYRRLKRIRKLTVPAYSHCKNCGEKLQGMYCSRCGQYALDTEQPFWKYIKQYFENVYQFDSKVWQTLWLLFRRPGLLTCEFNAGKINSYVHPFRLYMFISVVFFTIFFMFASDIARRSMREVSLAPYNMPDTVLVQLRAGTMRPDTTVYVYDGSGLAEMLELKDVPTDGLLDVEPVFGSRHGISLVGMPRLLLDSCLYRTELTADDLENIEAAQHTLDLYVPDSDEVDTDAESSGLDIEYDDAADMDRIRTFDPDRTPVYDWRMKYMDQNRQQERWEQENFVNNMLAGLSKWTPLYMMFLLPIFALLLKMAYRRRRMNYMHHFVHAIHINSFFLLLLFIPTAIMIYGFEAQHGTSRLTTVSFEIFFALVFIYMLLSSHTVYREGWLKTLSKTLFVFFSFSFLAICIALVLVIWMIYAYYY